MPRFKMCSVAACFGPSIQILLAVLVVCVFIHIGILSCLTVEHCGNNSKYQNFRNVIIFRQC